MTCQLIGDFNAAPLPNRPFSCPFNFHPTENVKLSAFIIFSLFLCLFVIQFLPSLQFPLNSYGYVRKVQESSKLWALISPVCWFPPFQDSSVSGPGVSPDRQVEDRLSDSLAASASSSSLTLCTPHSSRSDLLLPFTAGDYVLSSSLLACSLVPEVTELITGKPSKEEKKW